MTPSDELTPETLEKSWLALLWEIAKLDDGTGWEGADNGTFLEQFDPWHVLRRIVAEHKTLDEFKASFDLYDNAIRRGTAMWRKATGRDDVLPDTAKLVAWLLARIEALEENTIKVQFKTMDELGAGHMAMILGKEQGEAVKAAVFLTDKGTQEILDAIERIYDRQDAAAFIAKEEKTP